MDLHTFEELAPRRTMKDIATEVAERHGLTLKALCGPGRTRDLSLARFEAFWLCRREQRCGYPRWSLPSIGRFFGGRDHTTVMHGIRRYEELTSIAEAAE